MSLRLLLIVLFLACASTAHAARRSYEVDYTARFLPAAKAAKVTIKLTAGNGRATRLDFDMPAARYYDVTGDGTVERRGERVLWVPPPAGGALVYHYRVDHKRKDGAYDARITDDWAIVRGDDLFPSVRVRTTKDTDSTARLRFELPPGWTGYDTPYVLTRDRAEYVVVNPKRRFDRPVGWIVAGKIGVRREFLDGTELAIAAPKGENMRRVDMLAFLNVAYYEMLHAFGTMPPKILIIGAGDPMWRGGLSGPRSLFLHVDRPMVSENATSTLLHELTHVITRIRGAKGDDWITEGLAEFYSLELMRRTGLVTPKRYSRAIEFAKHWGGDVKSLRTSASSGKRTARAVLLLVALDREIKKKTDDRRDIDDVTQKLMEIGRVSKADLEQITERIIGGKSEVLDTPLLQ